MGFFVSRALHLCLALSLLSSPFLSSQRVGKMEKLRVSSVYLHSWRNQEESHTSKQGEVMTTWYRYGTAGFDSGGRTDVLDNKGTKRIYSTSELTFLFCLCLLCRKKWGAMTLTSRTGLRILAGQKSAVRKFLLLYFIAIWNYHVLTDSITAVPSRQASQPAQ